MNSLKKRSRQISAALLAAFLSLNNAEAQETTKGTTVPEYFATFGKTEVVLDPQYGYITSLDGKLIPEEKEKLFQCIDKTRKISRDVNLAVSGSGVIVYRDSKPSDDKRYTPGEGIYYNPPTQLAFPCVKIEKKEVKAKIENVRFTVKNISQKQDNPVTIDDPGELMGKESNIGIIEIDSANDAIFLEINANIPLDKRITLLTGAGKIYGLDERKLYNLPSLEETNFSTLEIIVATTKKDGKQFETLRLRINYSLSYIAEALTNLPEEKKSEILNRFAETSEDADLHYLLAEKLMEKTEQNNDSTRKVRGSYEKALQKDAKRLFGTYENPKDDYVALIGKNPFMNYLKADEQESKNYKKGQTDFFLVKMFENQWRTLYGKEIQDLVEEGPSLDAGMDNEEFMALLHNLAGMQAFDVTYIPKYTEIAKDHFKKAYEISTIEFFNTTNKERERQMKNLSQAYLANFYLVDLDKARIDLDKPRKGRETLRRLVKQIKRAKEHNGALYSFLPDYGFLADYLLCIAYYKLGDDKLLYETFKSIGQQHREKLFINNNYGTVTTALENVKKAAYKLKDYTISREVDIYLPVPPLPQPPLP